MDSHQLSHYRRTACVLTTIKSCLSHCNRQMPMSWEAENIDASYGNFTDIAGNQIIYYNQPQIPGASRYRSL